MATLQCGIDGLDVFSGGARSEAGQKFLRDVANGTTPASETARIAAQVRQDIPTEIAGKPVSVDTLVEFRGDRIREISTLVSVAGGNADGTDAIMKFRTSGGELGAQSFRVNGEYSKVTELAEGVSAPLLNTANSIARNHIAQLNDGTIMSSSIETSDGRARQRALNYMRWGYGPPYGNPSGIYGIVENGKLRPANNNYEPLSNEEVARGRQQLRRMRNEDFKRTVWPTAGSTEATSSAGDDDSDWIIELLD